MDAPKISRRAAIAAALAATQAIALAGCGARPDDDAGLGVGWPGPSRFGPDRPLPWPRERSRGE